ncbi:MAG: phenylalanine--tRNA ligase subunit beta [Planctomycetes bacterium]|nr:phenylalanine--tRNA ligase subunit beta [Planctomycetota bacterium]
MKLSLRWLTEHVDLAGIAPDEIGRQLTMKTALIEGVLRLGAGLEKVLVGLVVEREKHPNADRLSCCKVDVGSGTLVDVVCGAPNVAAGQKIAYAPVGATLPSGLTLEARKIRGAMSHGMICSTDELGLGGNHDGILVLPEEAPIGAPFREYFGVDDVIFEIDNKSITHRADLWGHYGFARELAAIFGRELRPLPIDATLRAEPDGFDLRVEDPIGCPGYLGLQVDLGSGAAGIPATPRWMARRLEAVGMRPVSLLVDLSNYVMLEIGQPTHPFDQDRLQGPRIVVRRAREGEKLTTLDGQSRELTPEDVVIADGERGVAIAGVMGGRESEVSASTQRVFLESASFEAARVRRTSSRLGLRSEAVARFEKTLDATLPEQAIRRYSHLLKQVATSAIVRAGFAAAGGEQARTVTLALRPERARSKLGMELGVEEMAARLRSIAFEVRADGDRLSVTVPAFRARRDVTCEDDLIEEVGRLSGYERALPSLPRLAVKPAMRNALRRIERLAVRCLVHECGYAETMGYSFASDRQVANYHVGEPESGFVHLQNSLTVDATRMRRSLMPGLLDAARRNLVEFDDVRLFDAGREYLPRRAADGVDPDGLPVERRVLSLLRTTRGGGVDGLLLTARGDVERLLDRLDVAWQGRAPTTPPPAFAHPGRTIEIAVEGRTVGVIAQLHPEVARRFEIAESAVAAEIDLDRIVAESRATRRMRPLSPFPPTRRDLAFETPESVAVADVLREIREAAGESLLELELFDVYRGKNLAPGHRSLAFRLVYRAHDRTLSDAEIEPLQQRIVERLARQGLKLRS